MQYKKITMTSEKPLDLESNHGEKWCVKNNTLSFLPSKFGAGDRSQFGDGEERTKQSPFKVFLFLKSFLNFCYCVLLVPFRIKRVSKGHYEISTNIVQQLFSTVLVVIITLYSLLDLRHYQRQQNLRERPDQTFKYATIFIVHWIPVCWLLLFWVRKAQFVTLIDVCYSRFLNQSEASQAKFRWWPPVLQLMIALIITKTLLFFYNEIWSGDSGSFDLFVEHVKERFLYDFGLADSPISKGRWPVALIFLKYFAAFINFLNEFTIYMFDQLCFTVAAMAFATCQNFLDEFQILIRDHADKVNANSNSTSMDNVTTYRNNNDKCSIIKKITSVYLDLIAVLDVINHIFGPCVMMFFMYLYPLFIWSVFDSLQNNSLIENLIRMHDMAILCLVTGTAAEASSKIDVFRQWLFEAAISTEEEGPDNIGNGLLKLATMHREVSSEAVGLKGYKFFTVTYRFVATMIGVVITYAIVMFQFVTDPRKAESSSSMEGQLIANLSASTELDNTINL